MASPAEELRAAMVARLQASESIAKQVGGKFSNQEVRDLPCAWVSVTQADLDSGIVEFLATVHVWLPSGAAELVKEMQAALLEPPPIETLSITLWLPDYTEIRLDNEYSAYRGLIRFRAQAKK